jgi:hypothetical protein
MTTWLHYAIGYGFATVVAHFPICWLVDRLYVSIGENPASHGRNRPGGWLTKIVGFVERALYVGAINNGAISFIGLWLVIKFAGQWSTWRDGIKDGDRVLSGQSVLNIFLIANGVSIAYALVGAYLIPLVRESVWASILVPVALLAATAVLRHVATRYAEEDKRDAGTGSAA